MRTRSVLLIWWNVVLIAGCLGLTGAVTAEEEEMAVKPDVILMKNGDRLTGDVVSKAGDTIKFKTPYAGTIDISWEQVAEVTMGDPETVLLADDRVMKANSFVNEGERIRIEPSDGSPPTNIAIEDLEKVVPEDWELGIGGKFTGRINFALKSESGNTESDELDFDYSLAYRRKHDRFRSNGIAEIDKDDGVRNKQDWTVEGKYDRFVNDKLYYGAFVQLKQEKFADLNLRSTVGPHVGYQFVESAKRNLSAELAWVFVNEDFISQADDSYTGPGWHLNYDHWLLEKQLQFYHDQYGNVRIDDAQKFVWRSFTGLRMPLGGGFVGSAEYEVDYDGQPATNAESTDSTFRLKLGYGW